ncbi:MAG: dTDP-4-dehydrorhamnose 3,5-epimerase [Longimicrobiales bacterium]|nr:dTDP-4-dehydrorhamnose 3,5-epimerase [Longimicrobiales bacterium]
MTGLEASAHGALEMGVRLLEAPVHRDARGYLREMTAEGRPPFTIAQTNHSFSPQRGTLRGLHFQRPPADQAKLVTVITGEVYDVAVDARQGSSTRGWWCAARLAEGSGQSLLIPAGFAHGFLTLAPDTHVVYHLSAGWDPGAEAGVRWDDPALAIPWPEPPVVIGERDRALPTLAGLER